MSTKFSLICCDSPWSFSDSLRMGITPRGADSNYPVLTMPELKSLPVNAIADPAGALLALWVPSALLQDGLDVMKAWGFRQTQTYIWVKSKKDPFKELTKYFGKNLTKDIKDLSYFDIIRKYMKSVSEFKLTTMLGFGMGRLFRNTHEICLIGINNNKIYSKLKNKSQRSVCFATNLKHSSKPEHLQDSLELMFPDAEKIELFARRQRPGWTCLGNEIDQLDIRDALNKLI